LPADLPADDSTLSRTFDRMWARSLLKEAARVQTDSADSAAARKRVELLRLRFSDGLPVKEIATRWGVDPAWVHHEYATARGEFRAALRTVVAYHHPGGTPTELDAACRDLLAIFR